MVLKPEPLFAAVEDLKSSAGRVILLSPRGKRYDQAEARRLAREEHLIFICGHYEGVDERVCRELVDEEISIGDYILTNGALPALVVVDSLVRLIPGVLGDPESSRDESFSEGRLEYPQYTRPEVFRGLKVPEVLLSGDHGEVDRWRRRQALAVTWRQRPDLIREPDLTPEEKSWLEELRGPARR
jgi:tRNA (guanine37-N1)-methyltransferase